MPTEDRRFYVYALFRRDGSPFYIGKGSRWRIDSHLLTPPKRVRNSHKDNIIASIIANGDDVPRAIIRANLSETEAFEIEAAFISAIGRLPSGPLVNMTDGGEGRAGRKLSEGHKLALSKANTGKKHSEKTRHKFSQIMKGNRRRVGKKNSAEHNARLSEAAKGNLHKKGKPVSAETRAAISAARKGKPCHDSTKQAVSLANKGRKIPPDVIARRVATRRANREKRSNALVNADP